MIFLLHVKWSCIIHAYLPFLFFFFLVLFVIDTFLFVSLSLSSSLSNSLCMAPKRKSILSWNPLCSGASSSDPTSLSVRFCDEKACQDFSENFSWHGIHSERRVILSNIFDTALPTIIHSRGWESLCEIPVSYPTIIIHEFYSNIHGFDTFIPQFVTQVWGIRIVVTPELIFDELHILQVEIPYYPSCPRLQTVSKDELSSLFYETPSSWGDCQNTPYSGFAKGSRYLNMVMTFVLHPLSHYNSITEPRARFFFPSLRILP